MGTGREKTRGVLSKGRAVLGWLAISGLGLSLSGCVIGPIIGQFTGRRSKTVKVDAKYKLPPGNLLILVDSPTEEAARNGVRTVLSRGIEREIRFHGLKVSVIPDSELSSFRSNREDFEKLDVARIGRELSAQQVLYVQVTEFQLGTLLDKPEGRGLVKGRVKVFDIKRNLRVWPVPKPWGYEVMVLTKFRELPEKNYQPVVTQDLCRRMAVKIVELFRKHREPRNLRETK